MDLQELKEQLVDLCQDGLDDLDDVEVTRKGLRLTFMSGDQFELDVRDVSEDTDDEDDEEEEEDGD